MDTPEIGVWIELEDDKFPCPGLYQVRSPDDQFQFKMSTVADGRLIGAVLTEFSHYCYLGGVSADYITPEFVFNGPDWIKFPTVCGGE